MKTLYGSLNLILLTVLIGTILVSCAVPINYLEPDAPKLKEDFAHLRPSGKKPIKVITFNIAHAKDIDRAIHEFTVWPELRDADIILLQEMDGDGTQRIARALKYNYVYYPASVHPCYHKDFGNAILSKWPISEEEKILLPHENPIRRQRRIAASATITIGDEPIRVYNVHTETILLSGSKRLEQVKTLVSHISEQLPSKYAIVGGDFNTVGRGQRETVVQIFEDVGLQWATKKVGTTSKTFLSLDHIYTKGMRVIEAGKTEESEASDHFPVWILMEKSL